MTIDTEEFYELMQTYRHMPTSKKLDTVNAYQAVIDHVDSKLNSHDKLVKALEGILERYTGLLNGGDCRFGNPEEEEEVIRAREALAAAKGE